MNNINREVLIEQVVLEQRQQTDQFGTIDEASISKLDKIERGRSLSPHGADPKGNHMDSQAHTIGRSIEIRWSCLI